MRAEHHIELPTADGQTVKCTIKKNTLALVREVQDLQVRSQFIIEKRATLWNGSRQVNAELAIAETALEHAPSGEKKAAKQTYDDAQGAYEALAGKIKQYDKETLDLTLAQLKLVVNISKGDAKKTPEIAWEEVDLETAAEAIYFFTKGKLPSPPTANA